MEEISVGVYCVTAVDSRGRKIERTGTDPEKIRLECIQEVESIQSTTPSPRC